ncbi:uncharacterized [Tachysurus ichikawai]
MFSFPLTLSSLTKLTHSHRLLAASCRNSAHLQQTVSQSDLQLLMKTQQSKHSLNTIPPKVIPIPNAEPTQLHSPSTQLQKPQQSLSPHRQLGRKHRNATVCSCQ